MPLVRCEVCGNKVAHNAASCPKCGNPSVGESSTNRVRNKRYAFRALLIVLVVVAAIYVVWSAIGMFPKNELPKGPGGSQNQR
jgi:predicted RNA-binding Zn-ribbon protein involved in translation (DUF1610 family)